MLRPCGAEAHRESNCWNVVTSSIATTSPHSSRASIKILTENSSSIRGREDSMKL